MNDNSRRIHVFWGKMSFYEGEIFLRKKHLFTKSERLFTIIPVLSRLYFVSVNDILYYSREKEFILCEWNNSENWQQCMKV